jgi:large subunit ribosomal protein L22
MTATKTNERPGTKALLRHSRMSASKARAVLDVIRGMEYTRARDTLAHLDRGAAVPIAKLLHSCAANAEHNNGLDPTELFVSACFADEGTTLKRWRPRARGRATRIRKRTCHITVILSPMPADKLARQRAKAAAEQADRRARRVAGARRRDAGAAATTDAEAIDELAPETAFDVIEIDADEVVESSATEVETTEEADSTVDETTAADAEGDAQGADDVEDADASESATGAEQSAPDADKGAN